MAKKIARPLQANMCYYTTYIPMLFFFGGGEGAHFGGGGRVFLSRIQGVSSYGFVPVIF